ncbi:hypothetical protein J31TS4_02510 [Paenibacillus sp. J31TS4]|uniref:formylglycine-generating enzyme family protein n=1 Tax=Paenibacillus sp. J31TS4 TaxID=2807195 RepID=UPI001B06FF2D|nr:formylglycine-generating enzyme family protein [Paenibacillus sp. J31TS4]GIP36971.1 hypothetical protein J31TS4_02510 [Paenibacillus sp. J31TS4]
MEEKKSCCGSAERGALDTEQPVKKKPAAKKTTAKKTPAKKTVSKKAEEKETVLAEKAAELTAETDAPQAVIQEAAQEIAAASAIAGTEREGMVLIPAGEFLMGNNFRQYGFPKDGEEPVHKVKLDAFYLDTTAVTNAQFREFVQATKYKTEAERFGWSFVFRQFVQPSDYHRVISRVPGTSWWIGMYDAYWYCPEGPSSTIEDRLDHPVVHVTWNDAKAYAKWAGKRLPTEAEWEYAARGGLEQQLFPWGNELTPDGKHMCNIWQGVFPEKNTARDGFLGTAPAKWYDPNGYGLYQVSGNVWEWTADWFSPTYYEESPEYAPQGPAKGERRSMRGGSYLCHKSYCNRYRVAARNSNTPDTSAGNIGFRCAADV